jgi:AraC family transcriptional regulator
MVDQDATPKRPLRYSQLGPTSLYFAEPDQFETYEQLSLGCRQGYDFAIATHRRDRTGLGPTAPTPVGPSYLVIVQLRAGGRCDLFRDARHEGRVELRPGSLTIMDLRHLWVADLQEGFHSFSFVVPQSMLDELTYDLHQSPITSLRCPISAEKEDQVILGLARALYPALENPKETSALAATHLFEAAHVHLAQHYGGVDPESLDSISGLSARQKRHVTEMLRDNLRGDPTMDELSRVCDLPSYRFARAFERSVGVAPHVWLMVRRIESAKNLLACTAQSEEAIAKFCGFATTPHFERTFEKLVGLTPGGFRCTRQH